MSQYILGNHLVLFIGILIGLVPALIFSLIGDIKGKRQRRIIAELETRRASLNFAFIQKFAIDIFYIKAEFPKEKDLRFSLIKILEHMLLIYSPTDIQKGQIYWVIAHGEKEGIVNDR